MICVGQTYQHAKTEMLQYDLGRGFLGSGAYHFQTDKGN